MLEDVLAASLGVNDAQQSAIPPCHVGTAQVLKHTVGGASTAATLINVRYLEHTIGGVSIAAKLTNVRFLEHTIGPSLPTPATIGFLSIHRFFWTSGSLRRIFSGSASLLDSRRTLGKTCSCGAGPEAAAALPLDRLRVAEAVPRNRSWASCS